MKLSNCYGLFPIEQETYLLPYGQSIADHRRGIKMNETGLLLWNRLAELFASDAEVSDAELSHVFVEEQLLLYLADYYAASSQDIPTLRQDIADFLMQLLRAGILINSPTPPQPDRFFSIASLTIGYHGPPELIPEELKSFACEKNWEKKEPDQHIIIHSGYPRQCPNGRILLRSRELIICSHGDGYMILYPGFTGLLECHVSKGAKQVDFYCMPPLQEHLAQEVFHAMRLPFLILAQQKGLFMLHSVSLLYHNKAWLFSGRSGTGKSTHAGLWMQQYQTPMLNGDLNLIGIENNTPYVYGIPWCGTSGVYTVMRYELGGLTLLKRHDSNAVVTLTQAAKQLLTTQRLISPAWTGEQLAQNLRFAKELAGFIPINRLLCTKDPEAAAVMKESIDSLWNLTE